MGSNSRALRQSPRAGACRSELAHAEHDVARLLAGLDVAGRLDDLVERVPPVDHGPVLARVDELLDEEEVLPAIAADAELRTKRLKLLALRSTPPRRPTPVSYLLCWIGPRSMPPLPDPPIPPKRAKLRTDSATKAISRVQKGCALTNPITRSI
jgi:hypothetical protein